MLLRFLLSLFLILSSFIQPCLGQASSQPNIVYIIADDISWDDFGCYGNPVVQTPVIDRLAEEGMRFTNAYLTASSCSPSRCSIISGRYPHNNGAAELHTPLPEDQVPFPLWMKEAGYYSVQAGKSHFGQAALRAFDHAYEGKEAGSGGEGRWVKCLQERPKDKPFFAWFASYDAHRAWQADDFGTPHDPDQISVPPYLVDSEATRQDLASYYNEIARFDYYIGEVVNELEKQGILENTLILVMADNGRPFPRCKTRVYDSGMKTPFVIYWKGSIIPPGSVCNSLISVVDIAPTFLELAGIEEPDVLQGKSFVPLLKDPSREFRTYVFSEHNWHDYEAHERMVRSRDFLYVLNSRPQFPNGGPADSKRSGSQDDLRKARDAGMLTAAQADVFLSPRPREELFYVHDDPEQLLNLASVSRYQAVLGDFRDVLVRWRTETGDNSPKILTGDGFDRETGQLLPDVEAFNKVKRGEMPGVRSGGLSAKGKPGF